MKKNNFTLILLISGFISLLSCQDKLPISEYTIIPEPQEIVYSNGIFKVTKDLSIAFPQELNNEAHLLSCYLEEDFSIQPILKKEENKATIILSIDKSLLSDKAESYKLDINKKNIIIKSNSPQGILHGIQSLRQVLKKEGESLIAQIGSITDYPSLSWRAFMLDEARYFKGKDVVYKLIDEMSLLKMNIFHWHLTNDQGWRIEINKYPLLTEIGAFRKSSEITWFDSNEFDGKPHGGFYTQDEIKDIVKYATDRHIQIVPEISMPGHACAAIAAYPWLGTSGKKISTTGKFGVHYEAFNVADKRVMQFFEDVFDEIIPLFPSPVIHIGGDEVKYNHWKESSEIQNYMRANKLKTPAELQVFFTNIISNMLESKGKRMMGWNEITGAKLHEYQSEKDTGVTQRLSPNSIVHFWKGDTTLVRQTIEKGYDVVNSYHNFTYLDYNYTSIPLSKSYSFNPIPDGLSPEQEKKVLGLGCQMWGEFIPTEKDMETKIFPRIAAYAEVGWTAPNKKDYNRFVNSLNYYLERWNKRNIGYSEEALSQK